MVRVKPEKISMGGDKFLYYNLIHGQSVCTRLSFLSRLAPSGEPGFEAKYDGSQYKHHVRHFLCYRGTIILSIIGHYGR